MNSARWPLSPPGFASSLRAPLLEPRFQRFLATYHAASPLSAQEVRFLREAYRFFILNYVLHVGEHFFQWSVAPRLQHEALEIYLPAADAMSLAPLLDVIS